MDKLISFKGAQHPKSVILYVVYFYVRFPASYRDLEEIMAERGVVVDHATLNRWLEKYVGAVVKKAQRRKIPIGGLPTLINNLAIPLATRSLNLNSLLRSHTLGQVDSRS